MVNRIEYLQKLLESTPNDSFLLFALAKEFETKGDKQEALGLFLRLQASDEGYVGLYYHLGKLYEKLEDQDQAVFTYKKGIEIAKKLKDHHAASELMGALLNIEDPDE
jgi:tetratricopeptide (TPR) repeat protein